MIKIDINTESTIKIILGVHFPFCLITKEVFMFYKKNESDYKTVMEGVSLKTIAFGEKTHLTEFRLSKGTTVPKHAHPHEQTGYLVSGRMTFVIEGQVFAAEPGDGWNIAGNIEHGVEVLEASIVIEVFSPVREEYLP